MTQTTSIAASHWKGKVPNTRLGLPVEARRRSAAALDNLLVHSMALRDLYKQAHWQATGPAFGSLHALFDDHHAHQLELIDQLGERIQTLGGVAPVLAPAVAIGAASIANAPRETGGPLSQITRLCEAHGIVIAAARHAARESAHAGDDGSNDLVVSAVLRPNETQLWVLESHLVRWQNEARETSVESGADDSLDEALTLTFPASDPVAVANDLIKRPSLI